MAPITTFRGEHRFLSNFYPARLVHFGIAYPTAEHAYVACKTLDTIEKNLVSEIVTPGLVKRYGRALSLRSDWEAVKLVAMVSVVTTKFQSNPHLMRALLETGDVLLQEGNTWGDRFWGVDSRTGEGENNLGKILMNIRANEYIIARATGR